MSAQWQHGLCGCFDNCGLCILSFLCPWFQLGRNASAVGESCFFYSMLACCGLGICAGVMVRSKIRERKGIGGDTIGDCMAYLCLPLCAIAQEAQEVQDLDKQSMARE